MLLCEKRGERDDQDGEQPKPFVTWIPFIVEEREYDSDINVCAGQGIVISSSILDGPQYVREDVCPLQVRLDNVSGE